MKSTTKMEKAKAENVEFHDFLNIPSSNWKQLNPEQELFKPFFLYIQEQE